MPKSNYYDGTKLLSLKDINGKTPEVFMCTSNRSAGKTTYFNRLVVTDLLNAVQSSRYYIASTTN